jgi:7,8-dihydropterin-6-yl-methyl-4-(beta-D-ribofuranosyl)aminobenzene 5'-phosphate synthase
MAATSPFRITTVVENSSDTEALLTEHGLAFWIERSGKRILFDTGQGKTLVANARQLCLPLATVDKVVLSHGHWDHAGGLAPLFQSGARPHVFLHPGTLMSRYSKWHKPPEEPISMPKTIEQALHERTQGITWTKGPVEVDAGIWVTGPIPRRTAYEDTGGPFYLDAGFTQPDLIHDDQALWLESKTGVVVLLGCAHAGVVNTLNYIVELTGETSIHAVIGGMHLLRAKRPRLDATLEALRKYQVQLVAPAHCTGERATAFLCENLGEACRPCRAGMRSEF